MADHDLTLKSKIEFTADSGSLNKAVKSAEKEVDKATKTIKDNVEKTVKSVFDVLSDTAKEAQSTAKAVEESTKGLGTVGEEIKKLQQLIQSNAEFDDKEKSIQKIAQEFSNYYDSLKQEEAERRADIQKTIDMREKSLKKFEGDKGLLAKAEQKVSDAYVQAGGDTENKKYLNAVANLEQLRNNYANAQQEVAEKRAELQTLLNTPLESRTFDDATVKASGLLGELNKTKEAVLDVAGKFPPFEIIDDETPQKIASTVEAVNELDEKGEETTSIFEQARQVLADFNDAVDKGAIKIDPTEVSEGAIHMREALTTLEVIANGTYDSLNQVFRGTGMNEGELILADETEAAQRLAEAIDVIQGKLTAVGAKKATDSAFNFDTFTAEAKALSLNLEEVEQDYNRFLALTKEDIASESFNEWAGILENDTSTIGSLTGAFKTLRESTRGIYDPEVVDMLTQLEEKLTSLQDKADASDTKFLTDFEKPVDTSSLDDIEEKLETIENTTESIGETVADVTVDAEQQIDNAGKAVESVFDQMERLKDDTNKDDNLFGTIVDPKNISEYIHNMAWLKEQLNIFKKQQEDVLSGKVKVSDQQWVVLNQNIELGNKLLAESQVAVSNYATGLQAISRVVSPIAQKFSQLGAVSSNVGEAIRGWTATARVDLNNMGVAVGGALNRFKEFTGVGATVRNAFAMLQDGAKNVGDVTSYALGRLADRFPNMADGARQVGDMLRWIGDSARDVVGNISTRLSGAFQGALPKVQSFVENVRASFANFAENTRSSLVLAVGEFINSLPQMKSAIQDLGKTMQNAFGKAKTSVKSLFSHLKSIASHIKGALTKALNKVKSSFEKAFSGRTLKRNLTTLIKYTLGVRSLYFAFRKLRSAVQEGLNNLVQFQSDINLTNTRMTEFKTSLLYLKNAWGAAFAPIINVVMPILNAFLDALASIGNAIARFVAALTGQNTVIQALKVGVGDYADSLAGAGSSASKAADEQKKLNDRLAAFDDLNVLGKDKDDEDTSPSGGGGGGGATPSVNDMFERIETPFNQFADLLKNGQFFEFGELLATKLSDAFERAYEWLHGEGREKVMKVATAIGEAIDGFLSVEDLGTNFGKMFGEAIVLGLDFINEIITPERMLIVGERIAEALNEAIPRIVPKLGETIGNLLSSAISGWYGFVSTADFAGWGDSIAQGINNFISEMNEVNPETEMNGWETLGVDISATAQGMIDALGHAIEGTDWVALGHGIGQVIGNIKWDDLKEGFKALWETIKNNFGSVIDEAELVSGLDLGGKLKSTALVAGVTALFLLGAKSGLIGAFGSSDLIAKCGALFAAGLAIAWGSKKIGEGAYDIGSGAYDLIADRRSRFGNTAGTIEGLWEVLDPTSWVAGFVDMVDDNLAGNQIENSASEQLSGLKQDIIERLQGIGRDWAEDANRDYFEAMVVGLEEFANVGFDESQFQNAFNVAKSRTQSNFGLSQNQYSDLYTKLYNDYESIMDELANDSELRTRILESLGASTTDASTEIEFIQSLATADQDLADAYIAYYEAVHGYTEELHTTEQVLWDKTAHSIADTINDGQRDMAEYYAKIGTGAQEAFGNYKETAKDAIENTADKLATVPEQFNNIKDSAETQTTAMREKFTTTFESLTTGSSTTAKTIEENFLMASDNIKESFLQSFTEIQQSAEKGGQLATALEGGLTNSTKALLNGMIAGINLAVTKPLQDLSKSFNMLRTLDVNGTKPFAGIPYLNVPNIPYLAQGAVIPPNKEFMAVLGDQKSGTNIEAPLDTIRQAVGDELTPYLEQLIEVNRQVIQAINAKPVISQSDIGRANANYTQQQKVIRGTMV